MRRLDAEAEIAEKGFVKDDRRDGEREIHDDDAGGVRQDVSPENVQIRGSHGAAGIDESNPAIDFDNGSSKDFIAAPEYHLT